MTKKRQPITAAELMAKLQNDPEFLAQQSERERIRKERTAARCAEEKPLLEELRELGFTLETVWDLVNTATPYPEAIPVLLKHLQMPYQDRIREGIARALAVPDAKEGWDTLIAEYRKISDPNEHGAKDGLAVAISAVSDDTLIDDLLRIIKDRSHGKSRILLLGGVKKSKLPEAKHALKELENDPDLEKEIKSWRRSK